MDNDLAVGKRIQQRRKELGISQTELAKRTGYTDKSAISKIESGINGVSSKQLPIFAKALQTTIVDLIGMDNKSYHQVQIDVEDLEKLQAMIRKSVESKYQNITDEDVDFLNNYKRLDAYDKKLIDMIMAHGKDEA